MERRTIAAVVSLIGAFRLDCAPACAGPTYQFVDLNPPGAETSTATGIDASEVVGSIAIRLPTGAIQARAVLWTGSNHTVVDLTPTDTFANGRGISGGHQVGTVLQKPNVENIERAFLWSGSRQSGVDLTPSGFSGADATGVWGDHQVGSGVGPGTAGDSHALLWSGTAGSFVDLNPFGASRSLAFGVYGSKQVGFYLVHPTGPVHAVLWTGSAASAVDLHPGTGFSNSIAHAVFAEHEVGEAVVAGTNGISHATLWSGSAGSAVDLHPGPKYLRSIANAIAGNKEVGVASLTGDSQNLLHAMVWSGTAGSAVDLDQFVPKKPGLFEVSEALGIDANGVVVGIAGYTPDPETIDPTFHAVQWLPETHAIPLPPAAGPGLMVMTALAAILAFRRRGAVRLMD